MAKCNRTLTQWKAKLKLLNKWSLAMKLGYTEKIQVKLEREKKKKMNKQKLERWKHLIMDNNKKKIG